MSDEFNGAVYHTREAGENFKGAIFHTKQIGGGGGGSDPHNLGWYADLTALQTAHPTGQNGDFAILGSTDTVWVWDSGTSAWVDTDKKGQVVSVNNKTGEVVLTASDVGAATSAQGGKADTAVQPSDLGTAAYSSATDFATAAQGAKADTAVQPADLGTAAYSSATDFATAAQGVKADTAVQPADLGTAAYAATTDFATAAQGAKADTAVQPADLATVATTGDYNDLLNKPSSQGGMPQYSSLPTASASNVGTIAQYTGETIPNTPETATVEQTTGKDLTDLAVDTATFVATEQPEGAETVDFSAVYNSEASVSFKTVDSLEISANTYSFMSYMGNKLGVPFADIPAHATFWTLSDDGFIYCGLNPLTEEEEIWFDDSISNMYGFTVSGIQEENLSSADYDFTAQGATWYKDGSKVNLSQYGVTYSGTPTTGDVLTVTYTPLVRGINHAYIFESIVDELAPASATVSQTTGSSLSDLSVDVTKVESYYSPTGDATYTYTASVTPDSLTLTPDGNTQVEVSTNDFQSFIIAQGIAWTSAARRGRMVFGADNTCTFERGTGSYTTLFTTTIADMEQAGFTVTGYTDGDIITYRYITGTTSWEDNLGNIFTLSNIRTRAGISYTGTPVDGDVLTTVYTAESPVSYKWERTDVQPSDSGGGSGGIDWKTKVDLPANVLPYATPIYPVYTIEGGLPDGTYEVYYYVKNSSNNAVFSSMTSKILFKVDNDHVNGLITPLLNGNTVLSGSKALSTGSRQDSNRFLYSDGSNTYILFTGTEYSSSDIRNSFSGQFISECFKLSAIKNVDTGEEYIATGEIFDDQNIGTAYTTVLFSYPLIPLPTMPTSLYGGIYNISDNDNAIKFWNNQYYGDVLSGSTQIYAALRCNDGEFVATLKGLGSGYEIEVEKASGIFANTCFAMDSNGIIYLKYNTPVGTTAVASGLFGFFGNDSRTKVAESVSTQEVLTPMNALKIGETPVLPNYYGKILQYTGTTNANYTNGYFYKVTGTLVTIPASVDCVETSSYGKTITMDVDNFVSTVVSVAGITEVDVVNWLKGTEEFTYDVNAGTLSWGWMLSFDQSQTAEIMQYITISPAASADEVISWQCENYVDEHTELQNGAWELVDVQPANSLLQSITGYDATKTQVLKNVSGTFTWVDE